MTVPANIRVNTSVPFPALVQVTAPLTISKVNGVWNIGLNPPGSPFGAITVTTINGLAITTTVGSTLAIPSGALITLQGTDTYVGRATTDTLTNKIVNNQSLLNNFSTALQTPSATVRTYITGSLLSIPVGKLQIGTIFRWKFNMTKTGAGSATSTIDVAVGTAGTTADTARVSFTKPAGTAAIDEAYCQIEVICRGPLSASGVFSGEFQMTHNLAATGHATIPVVVVNTVSGTFDVTVANLKVGLCITTGASDVITIQQCVAEAINL